MRQLKVFFVPLERMAAVLKGSVRVRNLPDDAQAIAFQAVDGREYGKGVGLLVTSCRFPLVPEGEPLPVTRAQFACEADVGECQVRPA